MKRILKDQSLLVSHEVLLFVFSIVRALQPELKMTYNSISISFVDVDDMSKGRDDVDVDTSV